MNAAAVDALLEGPALVFGSLPPHGRDLDLLLEGHRVAALEDALRANGWEQDGSTWVSFGGCTAFELDIAPVEGWALPPAEVVALYDEARPIEGYSHLVRPAPHHLLLIMARRISFGATLEGKKRACIVAALEEDPDAWGKAGAAAGAWGQERSLAAMRAAMQRSALENVHRPGPRARAARLLRRRRGLVVAMSGIDGSGKSSQAESLRTALQALGHEAHVEWMRLPYIPSLDLIARPVKRLLARGGAVRSDRTRRSAPVEGSIPEGAYQHRTEDEARLVREKSPILTYGWTLMVAVATGLKHRRTTMPKIRRGIVVIRDRYTLDSAVGLRYRYGERPFRLQLALIRWLSPKPSLTFWFDVPPEDALARKLDKFSVPQLRRQSELYAELSEAYEAHRLDATRSPELLCAEIGLVTWKMLRRDLPSRR